MGASLVVQLVKNPPAIWETWVQFLGWEDPLVEGMAIDYFLSLQWTVLDTVFLTSLSLLPSQRYFPATPRKMSVVIRSLSSV